ncbi:MAG: hypothetical protein EOP05_18770 [Proteobacteria bacterium]|nr:MAG: hypothetical protein EOP05_18770 [Pseudomonadota bacterium]
MSDSGVARMQKPEWTTQPYNPYPPKQAAPSAPPPLQRPKGRSMFALFAMAGVLILVGALLVSTFFLQAEVERQVTKAIKKALVPVAPIAEVKFSKVKVSLWRQRVHLLDLKVKLKSSGETLQIDRASIGGIDFDTLKEIALTRKPVLPKALTLQFDGVELPSGLVGEKGNEFLKSLGYSELRISTYFQMSRDPSKKTFDLEHFDFQMSRDPSKKTFDLEHFEVAVGNLGDFDLSFSIGNLNLPTSQQFASLKKDPKKFIAEAGDFTKLTLRGFELTFKDDSLVERATKAFIAMGESSPMALVDLAIQANTPSPFKNREVAASRVGTDFTLPALSTLKKFLARPSKITLAARPPKAIPVMSLLDDQAGGSVNELAKRLSLVVE